MSTPKFFAKSLKKRMLFLTMLVSILPVIILFAFLAVNTEKDIERQINQQYQDQLDNFSNYLNRLFQTYTENADQITRDSQICAGLSQIYNGDLISKSQFYIDTARAFLNINIPSGEYTVYYDSQELFNYRNFLHITCMPDDILEEIKNSPSAVWKIMDTGGDPGADTLSLFMKFNLTTDKLAVLQIDIAFDTLCQTYQESFVMENVRTFYEDESHAPHLLSGEDQLSDKEPYSAITRELDNGHYLRMDLYLSPLPQQFVLQYFYMMAIFLISVGGICFLDYITIRKLTRSLESFIGQLNHIETEKVENIEITEQDEIGIIKQKFVELLKQNQELYRQKLLAEKNKKLAEIDLMHSKLNPHLLYNSLSVIKWKSLASQDQDTYQLIEYMTKYYRAALSKGNPIFTFGQELELIKNYVAINQFAHGEDYQLEIDVDPEIYQNYTIKLLLQPFVENSILHGLHGIEREKLLKITGKYDGDDIVFTVEDNGYGIPEEKLETLNHQVWNTGGLGYGVRNIAERIQIYFGPGYGIRYESRMDVFTRVTIRVPRLSEEQLIQKM